MHSGTYQALIYELINNVDLTHEQAEDVIQFMDSEGFLDNVELGYYFNEDNEENEEES